MDQKEIEALLAAPRETLSVEHKSWLDLTTQSGRAVLAKAIIALANHGGGHIVIGIKENGADRQAEPRPDAIAKYKSDDIAAVVKKFVDPLIDCSLTHASDPVTGHELAVIAVPTGIGDLVLSKSGVDDNTIIAYRPYIRKPGPASEMPNTLAEWRQLFERGVKARQVDMLSAIRAIVTGAPLQDEGILPKEDTSHRDFYDASIKRWQELTAALPDKAPAKMPFGHWSATIFFQGDLKEPSLKELNEKLRQAGSINHSGWPPFPYISRPPIDPKAVNNSIEAWMYEADVPERDPSNLDYWRFSRDGHGFMVRGYQEDASKRFDAGTGFDITVPTWRAGEVILFSDRLARLYEGVTKVTITFTYKGLKGRQLVSYGNSRRNIMSGRTCFQDVYSASITFNAGQSAEVLPELVYRLLAPLYELFGFFELPRQLVAEELTSMQEHRF